MKLTKKTIELVCEIENIIGNSIYNPNSTNGYTGEVGSYYRYPVHYTDKDGKEWKYKGQVSDINSSGVDSMYYGFGSNQLLIGEAIVEILEHIEERFDISFNDLVKKKKK